MSIKIGDYARDNRGEIFRVMNFYERGEHGEICVQLADFRTGRFLWEDWERDLIINSDIRRLIKVGDYVNGYKVFNTENGIEILDDGMIDSIFINEIKDIVTKEEFESIKYKLKECDEDGEPI